MIQYDPNKKKRQTIAQPVARPVAQASAQTGLPQAKASSAQGVTLKPTQATTGPVTARPTQTMSTTTPNAVQPAPTAAPGEYKSTYQDQLDKLYEQIQGNKFNYNLNGDPLWAQTQAYYMQQGQNAMRDTIGQASALTGGYGSSYAQNVGQQAYNQHIQELMAQAPAFEEQARARYDADRAAMLDQYGLLLDKENQEYSRWMDKYSQWLNEYDRWWQEQQAAQSQANWQAEMDEDKRRWEAETGEDKRRWEAEMALAQSSRSGSGSGGSSSGGSSSGGHYEVDSYMASVAQELVNNGVGFGDLAWELPNYYYDVDDELVRTIWAYMQQLDQETLPGKKNPSAPGKNPNEIYTMW